MLSAHKPPPGLIIIVKRFAPIDVGVGVAPLAIWAQESLAGRLGWLAAGWSILSPQLHPEMEKA